MMNSGSVNEVKRLLPQLNANELKEVVTLATQLRSSKGLGVMRAESELFYHTLSEELSYRLNTLPPPLSVLKKQSPPTYKKFDEVLTWFNDWLDDVMQGSITRLQRRTMYAVCTELVADEVEASQVPLSLKSLLNFYPELPGILDKNFPGYIRNGMIGMLLEASRVTPFEDSP